MVRSISSSRAKSSRPSSARDTSRRFSISAAAAARRAPRGRSPAGAARSTASIDIRGPSTRRTGRTVSSGITGYAGQGDIARAPIRGRKGHGILAAYSINELDDETRVGLLSRLAEAKESGSHVLVIEPIAKRALTWWAEWETRFLPQAAEPTNGDFELNFRNASVFLAVPPAWIREN